MLIPQVAGQYSWAGIPDRYLSHSRWRGWIELKAVAGVLSKAQKDMHKMMRERGEQVAIVWFTKDDELTENTALKVEYLGYTSLVVVKHLIALLEELLCRHLQERNERENVQDAKRQEQPEDAPDACGPQNVKLTVN